MSNAIKDYIPKLRDKKSCIEFGHNFKTENILHRLYKTCPKCGHIELLKSAKED